GVVSKPQSGQEPPGQVTGDVPGGPTPAPGACGSAGHVGPHRLNRAEYLGSVRDILGLDAKSIDVDFLPQDREAGDYVNIAEKYDVSQQNLEQYLDVAETVVAQAFSTVRDKLLYCDRAARGDAACLTDTVTHFATLAFRRPPSAETLADLMKLTNA